MKFTSVLLALCATAMAADSRPFKFKLVTPKSTVYLTATGAGASSPAGAVDCTISGGAISCGPNRGGLGTAMHSKMQPSARAANNRGWSVTANNRIVYAPFGKPYNLVTRGREMWVENCDAHPDGRTFTKGEAYAVYA